MTPPQTHQGYDRHTTQTTIKRPLDYENQHTQHNFIKETERDLVIHHLEQDHHQNN